LQITNHLNYGMPHGISQKSKGKSNACMIDLANDFGWERERNECPDMAWGKTLPAATRK
jgi:hypothetical protein